MKGIPAVALAAALLYVGPVQAQMASQTAEYSMSASEVIEQTVEAHGGRAAFENLPGLSYWFFTRNTGAPDPWLSIESIDFATGRSVIEWPVYEAKIWSDGESAWSRGWPLGFSPGFFPYLTPSFVTLPFLLDGPGVHLGEVELKKLPEDDTDYLSFRITFEEPRGLAPGTYYRMYVNPETFEYRAIEFDINHPGLVANPNQPLGPNIHVFQEFKNVGGVRLASYYNTYGQNRRNNTVSTADHWLFAVSTERPFSEAWEDGPDGEQLDAVTTEFWKRSQLP